MAEDIGFALNYTNILEIDITPNDTKHTWAWVGPGIKTINPENSETVDETPYYDGEGVDSADVIGGKIGYAVSGSRRFGDAAQDYVSSLAYVYGESRKTHFRRTSPDGEVIEGKCTLTDIVAGQGDANSKGDFSFKIKANGRPTIKKPTASSLPASITAQAVTAKIGKTAEVTATVTPTTASKRCLFAIEDDTIASVDADGVVTGIKTGETNLTIKAAAKPSVATQIKVTVEA